MKDLITMIVDDSGFSAMQIKGLLEKKGLSVHGQAESMKEAITMAQELKPDFITMDITLPDGDGIQCSKAILRENPAIKILAISAMLDEELLEIAKDAGIKAFIQKPITEMELYSTIDKLFSGEDLYKILKENFSGIFKNSFLSNVKRSMDEDPVFQPVSEEDNNCVREISGFSVTIGIIGKHLGRMILDVPEETAGQISRHVYSREEVSQKEMVAFFGEFANVIAGNACSKMNAINKSFGLRVSPPTVFHGKDLVITICDMRSESFILRTKFGPIYMNVGFRRGDDEWM